MAKIKITDKQIEIEGKIEKGRVTPFGTSAHIPFKKKHTGKSVSVVVPASPKYVWLINKREKITLLKSAKENIEKKDGKLEHYRLGLIDELENDEFNLDALVKILEFVGNRKLVRKIVSLYNLEERY